MTADEADALVAGLFDPAISCVASGLDYSLGALHSQERALVESAVASRQRDFSTGRVLARRLIEARGRPAEPLLRDPDRVPIWPTGIVGSISHTKGLAVAAIAESEMFQGIGIDVEPDEAVGEGVERIVCREVERPWLDLEGPKERGRRCKIVFSIKEAVYKAFYPRVRVFWNFHDVEVDIDLVGESFQARLPESAGRASIPGRIVRRGGWILSAVQIENERSTRARPSS